MISNSRTVALTTRHGYAPHPSGFWRYTRHLCASLARLQTDELRVLGIGQRSVGALTTVPTVPAEAMLYHDMYNGTARDTRAVVSDSKRDRKLILTVHDLIPITHPHLVTRGEVQFFESHLPGLLDVASLTITPSHITADLLASTFGIDRKSLRTIYPGVAPVDTPHARSSKSASLVLHVGGYSPRKNLAALLRAWPIVHEALPTAHLICAGAAGPELENPPPPGVSILGPVDDVTLQSLYARAVVFVYPSVAEGFGFPPLEAMRHHIAVVAADTPVFRETLGNAALFLEPTEEGLASMLIDLLNAPEQIAMYAARGYDWVDRYSWNECALAHREVYKTLLP